MLSPDAVAAVLPSHRAHGVRSSGPRRQAAAPGLVQAQAEVGPVPAGGLGPLLTGVVKAVGDDVHDVGVPAAMYPFITDTEFSESLRGETDSASQPENSHAPKPQSPEQVADVILDLIKTGAEQADLVPEQFGGSYKRMTRHQELELPTRNADQLPCTHNAWRQEPRLRRSSHQ